MTRRFGPNDRKTLPTYAERVRGKICLSPRPAMTGQREDGTKLHQTISGLSGVAVTVKPDSQSRRKFAHFVKTRNLIAIVAETGASENGAYCTKCGYEYQNASEKRCPSCHEFRARDRGDELPSDIEASPSVTRWEVYGTGSALSELTGGTTDGQRGTMKPYLEDWGFIVRVRVGQIAGGDGTEKPRPGSGSYFGRPEQIRTTAQELDSYRKSADDERPAPPPHSPSLNGPFLVIRQCGKRSIAQTWVEAWNGGTKGVKVFSLLPGSETVFWGILPSESRPATVKECQFISAIIRRAGK